MGIDEARQQCGITQVDDARPRRGLTAHLQDAIALDHEHPGILQSRAGAIKQVCGLEGDGFTLRDVRRSRHHARERE